jgi:hypothetical protein
MARGIDGGHNTLHLTLNERLHTVSAIQNEVLPIYWNKVRNFLYSDDKISAANMGLLQPQAARELLSVIHSAIGTDSTHYYHSIVNIHHTVM